MHDGDGVAAATGVGEDVVMRVPPGGLGRRRDARDGGRCDARARPAQLAFGLRPPRPPGSGPVDR